MSLLTYSLLKRRIDELETRLPGAPIYGVYWNKGPDPTLIRTHDAVGMEANVGVDGEWVHNDFDRAEIFSEIGPVTDDYGNVFIRIPKFYIRKIVGTNFRLWQVSKTQYPGFYLPACFWDFARQRELPYVDVGKYKASLGNGNRLESKPDTYPLADTNIVNFRAYARNNNADGLKGYQLLDIHVVDILRTLIFIEFATLNMQSIMAGYSSGRYTDTDRAVAAEIGTNRIVVDNAVGANYRVGQAISVGSSLGGNQRFYGRTITAIEVDTPEVGQTAISFDGDPVDISIDDRLYNTGWKSGFSGAIAASSGGIGNLLDGKYPCTYRGIESPYGDVWQFVDGLNINEFQSWVCRDAEQYASNLFAAPYEQLGYVNASSNGYVSQMGYDAARPYAELPIGVSTESTTYYSDYYYQSPGQRVARVGGSWYAGSYAGPSCWYLNSSSSDAIVNIGGRLLKKAL